MKPRIRVLKKGEDDSNIDYWLALSRQERLIELEELRQQYISWRYDNKQGF